MRIELHNIGPIRDACVELGPLTVLIGPNGSGKTILSSVTHAAATAARQASLRARVYGRRWETSGRDRPQASDIVARWEEAFRETLQSELQRCCAEDLTTLGREYRAGRNAAPRITIGQGAFSSEDTWNVIFRLDADHLVVERSNKRYRPPHLDQAEMEHASPSTLDRYLLRAFAGPPTRSYYFPASRSGLMQTFSTLTALVFGALGAGYFEDVTLGKIPGLASDFLQFLAQIDPTRTTRIGGHAIDLLERELLHGHISLDVSGPARKVSFAPDGFTQTYPIESAATSTAEIAPLLLYLRHVATPADALFIDEPEAHFHPRNQVSLARALTVVADEVRNVVLATHSEFLLAELSNIVMERAGEHSDHRSSTPLHIYEFVPSDPRGGVSIRRHEFEPLEGFDIEQFSTVAEETYDRSVDIYNRVHGHESTHERRLARD
ncbi:MAG: AAA family ATPase [Solirubrobacteraceae bacterium]